MRRPLYVWGQRPRYPSNMRLGGAQVWKNSLVFQSVGYECGNETEIANQNKYLRIILWKITRLTRRSVSYEYEILNVCLHHFS